MERARNCYFDTANETMKQNTKYALEEFYIGVNFASPRVLFDVCFLLVF